MIPDIQTFSLLALPMLYCTHDIHVTPGYPSVLSQGFLSQTKKKGRREASRVRKSGAYNRSCHSQGFSQLLVARQGDSTERVGQSHLQPHTVPSIASIMLHSVFFVMRGSFRKGQVIIPGGGEWRRLEDSSAKKRSHVRASLSRREI